MLLWQKVTNKTRTTTTDYNCDLQQQQQLLLHPFNGLFSRTTWVSWYQKSKINQDWNKARDDEVLGWQWYHMDHMQTICTLLQTDNHISTQSLNFYSPDALPDTQTTVSKHWRQIPNNSQHSIKYGATKYWYMVAPLTTTFITNLPLSLIVKNYKV